MHPSRPPRPWRIVHSEASLGWGGQERRIFAELAGFRQRGSEVWLLAPQRSQIFREASAAGIPCRALPESRLSFVPTLIKTAVWLRRIRAEVVNPHSSRDGWVVGLAARLAGAPLVIRSRHFDVPIGSPWLSRHAYVTLCDHVITTSPKVADDFRRIFRLPEDRVTALPTGVDLQEFSPQGPRVEFQFPPAADGPQVGMVGIIRVAKGHSVLLEAARQLCDSGFPIRCVFVGDGPNRPAVERKVEELRLQDRVLFTGMRKDIPAVLRSLDLLALPSLHEAVPQTGLQALAVQTPVVGSDVGGIPSIVRPGETGRLAPPGDAAAWARTIRAALIEKDVSRQLAERGRAMVEKQYSLGHMLDRLDGLYHRHLER